MQNKDLDFALVGHNFITFLLSLGLLNRGKKILILDDDRFNYGEFFTNSLTGLDVAFLKKWGKEERLLPLENLENYLTPEKVYFFTGKKQVVLGDLPHRNFRELCRKFPSFFLKNNLSMELFSSEDEIANFNNIYNNFCQKISDLFFHEKNVSKLSTFFENAIPENLQTNFQFFFLQFGKKELMSENEKYLFNAFIFMVRGFFQNRLSISGSKEEIMHLFFSLISPYYKLNHEKLVADLLSCHLEKGGEFKKLNLADLKFQRGVVKSFELESFDGLIRPRKIAFVGGYPVGLPIKLKTATTISYNCLNVIFTFKEEVSKLLDGKKYVFTSSLKTGTERPFWEVLFASNTATFNVIMGKKEGGKVDFIFEKMREVLSNDLFFLFPEHSFVLSECKMKFTLDIFIEDKNFLAHKKLKKTLAKKIVDVLEDTTPLLISRLKNVLYFGPYNEDSLGTFASLVEIKRWRDSL